MDSGGNRVNLGNFVASGLNVNNYWDDNRNDNIGLASARNFSLCLNQVLQLIFSRSYPSTQHFTDLIHYFFHLSIFPEVN